ncbi:membrane-targeted effector domain-containing toxin [Pseudomonas sp. 3A(2025)]
MQTFTAVAQRPADTLPAAVAALKSLADLNIRIMVELRALPAVDDAQPDAVETASLLQRLDDYWEDRSVVFLNGLQQALHDELSLKIHERNIEPRYAQCLPGAADQPAMATQHFALHIQLQAGQQIEVAGALVMSHEQGHTLLVLPGLGATGFASRSEMTASLARWLNDPQLRDVLLNCVEKSHQQLLTRIDQDPDLYLEPFTAAHLLLRPISDAPYAHAIARLCHKQREDMRHACTLPDVDNRAASINRAIAMQGLFGPAAMLELRELAYLESRYRQSLPGWIKSASAEDLSRYGQSLQHYDQARTALLSVLGAAASPEQFALAHLRTRLSNDLGDVPDPATITVSTRRTLAVTGETFTVTRSLVDLALYGLHPGDRTAGSEFLEHTTLTVAGTALSAAHSSLTPAYLGQLVEELDLRLAFKAFQHTHYHKDDNQQLMRLLTRRQIAALAFAAQMQGHIQPEDFAIVQAMTQLKPGTNASGLSVQHVRLGGQVLSKLLVFRQETASGQPERLVMVATDAPHTQPFRAFHTEKQLLQELVGWSTSDALTQYLLSQLQVDARAGLAQRLADLKLKPQPTPDFMQLVSLADYDSGLRTLAEEHVRVALSEQARHTPDWYRNASLAQRQELLALEDRASAALKNYEAKAHTRLQPFKDYVHARASQKIGQLLGLPTGRADPDRIIITTERESVSYTDMLLKGYDDSIDFINAGVATQATFSGPEGIDLSPLSPMSVAASIRGRWLADDYIALTKGTLLNALSDGYQYRRNSSVLITRLQMQAAALRSLLKGHIDATQYQWLRDSLDHTHLNDAHTREKYPLYPLQIHVDKPFIGSQVGGIDQLVIPTTQLINIETVQGCIAVLPTTVRQAALLYTPQAPDGLEWRLFSNFTESLGTPGMIDYYKDRCRSQAGKTLSFFLRDMQQGNANKPPFLPKDPIADFADTCFNRRIMRTLREVEDTTTGRNDMLARLIWTSVEVIATVVTLPFPPASFAVGALLYLHDTVRAFQALRDGDTEAASAWLLTAMLNGLGAAGDLQAGLKGFGGLLRQSGQAPRTPSALPPLQRQPSLPRYEDLFPVTVHDEPFLLGKADINGHFPVVRTVNASSPELRSTGHFASPAAGGTWQPLGTPLDASAPNVAGVRNGRPVELSLQDVPRMDLAHGKGVCAVNGKHYIEFSGKTWQVHYDAQIKCWQIIDPHNPFSFFGKQPVRLDEQGTWQLLDRQQLRGGGLNSPENYRPLPEQAGASNADLAQLSQYQLPASMQPHLDIILSKERFDPTELGLEDYFEALYKNMRDTFSARREKLYQDAHAFFLNPPLPPRPALPALPSPVTLNTLVETVFTHSNGMVLSEAPRSVASKRLLILNMPLWAEQQVEILYIEHVLLDKHLHKLARYRKVGKKSRSGSHEIKHHLEQLNDKALDNHTTEYDYYHLIKAAHRSGIEVRPFNSSISYPFADHPVGAAAGDTLASQKMSNFFGHTLISSDVASDSSRRWIALLDEKLAGTHDQLPGLAELQGVPSVQIKDVAGGQPIRITPASQGAAGRFDFTLEFANPQIIAEPVPPSTPLDLALFKELGSKKPGNDIAERWGGDYGFRWSDTDGWQQIEPGHWTPDKPLTAIGQSLADATYDMPVAQRSTLHQLANFEHKGLDHQYAFMDPTLAKVRKDFFDLRSTLQADARTIITAELPARPTLPAIAPQISLPDLLETLYQHSDAVVIGEVHSSIASKKLIIDNLPLLSQQNVKTLYMEHLFTDLHQADLDRFFETGEMSKRLLHDLKKLDRGHHTDPSGIYTFERLVLTSRQSGLEVRAIDCSASYYLKSIDLPTPTTRQQMMSYFASRTIDRHQEVIGAHKWIALVGNSHSNTYQKIVPGLAELQGGIGLRVVDVPPGHSTSVVSDPGEFVRFDLGEETVQIKGDYRVDIEVVRSPATIRPPLPLSIEERLNRPGKFLVEQGEGNQHTIVHRSRDAQIHRTPVQVNAEGKLYLDRSTWATVHLTPYDDMDALVAGLEEINLTRVG